MERAKLTHEKCGEDSSTTGVDEGDAEGRSSKREERVSGVAKNLGGDRRDGKSEIDAVREESGDLEAVVEDVRVGGLRGADCGREGSDVLQVEDLERYVKELNEGKECVMVLNKADLLHEELRSAWADKFDDMGVKYLFWSAKAATEKIERDAILEKRTRALARLEAEERANSSGSTRTARAPPARMKGRKEREKAVEEMYRRRRRRPR